VNPQEIMNGMKEKNRMLSMKNDELAELSEKKAVADRDYKVAYAQKVAQLKINGESVTIIPSLAKGDKAVADLCYKADIAEGVFHACREKIKDLRVQIDSYRSLLTWLRAELTGQE